MPKGAAKVLEHLNNELTAINQYFLPAHMLDEWSVTKLAKHEYALSIEEMKHADDLTKRILYRNGLPKVQWLNT